jgi:hypothetical protein
MPTTAREISEVLPGHWSLTDGLCGNLYRDSDRDEGLVPFISVSHSRSLDRLSIAIYRCRVESKYTVARDGGLAPFFLKHVSIMVVLR